MQFFVFAWPELGLSDLMHGARGFGGGLQGGGLLTDREPRKAFPFSRLKGSEVLVTRGVASKAMVELGDGFVLRGGLCLKWVLAADSRVVRRMKASRAQCLRPGNAPRAFPLSLDF